MAQILKTVRVTGPAGILVINERDLAAFRVRGYEEVAVEMGGEPSPVSPVNLNVDAPASPVNSTLEELRVRAASLGIINAGKLSEQDLRDALAWSEGQTK